MLFFDCLLIIGCVVFIKSNLIKLVVLLIGIFLFVMYCFKIVVVLVIWGVVIDVFDLLVYWLFFIVEKIWLFGVVILGFRCKFGVGF